MPGDIQKASGESNVYYHVLAVNKIERGRGFWGVLRQTISNFLITVEGRRFDLDNSYSVPFRDNDGACVSSFDEAETKLKELNGKNSGKHWAVVRTSSTGNGDKMELEKID